MPNGDWVYKYPQGLHEFRAVPLDAVEAELPHYQALPSSVIIDNVPPVINSISSTGNETHVIPGESVDFVAEIMLCWLILTT
jgi:hypothetical protein